MYTYCYWKCLLIGLQKKTALHGIVLDLVEQESNDIYWNIIKKTNVLECIGKDWKVMEMQLVMLEYCV
jgi:hypothetical protein